jgi:predicted O-linked N-acetylglucosamine transferase (SPINDLY family)
MPLSCLGLGELIAETSDAYIEIAVRLANNLPRLGELRAGLRERMQHSVLIDVAGFTRHLEEAYSRMWERWLNRNS